MNIARKRLRRGDVLVNKLDKQLVEKTINLANLKGNEYAITQLPLLDSIEIVNNISNLPSSSLNVVIFNIEQGKTLEMLMAYFDYHPVLKKADIILINEADDGMSRSKNLNITKTLAEKLRMNYVFDIEFLDITDNSENLRGYTGNAILSKFKFKKLKHIRLPNVYDWFHDEQKRLGTRCALLTTIDWNGTEVGIVCGHLENRTTPQGRVKQMDHLLSEIKKDFGSMPIIIGGDLNTNTVDGSDDNAMVNLCLDKEDQKNRLGQISKFEEIFEVAKAYGYDDIEVSNIINKSTRRKHIKGQEDLLLNLDWFITKGVECIDKNIIEGVFKSSELIENGEDFTAYEGKEISDHDGVSGKFILKK